MASTYDYIGNEMRKRYEKNIHRPGFYAGSAYQQARSECIIGNLLENMDDSRITEVFEDEILSKVYSGVRLKIVHAGCRSSHVNSDAQLLADLLRLQLFPHKLSKDYCRIKI